MTAELRKTNAKVAGWPWCDLHDAPRWNGPDSCYRSHQGEHVPMTMAIADPEDQIVLADPDDFDPYMPKCCLCGRYHYGGCG